MNRIIPSAIFLPLAFFLGTKVYATQLSGVYTIDPIQAATATNFKNFSSAVTYLTGSGARSDAGPSNTAPFGVSGPVVFNVASATFNEQAAFSAAIAGLSTVNTISFNGTGFASSVLQFANSNTSSGGALTFATVSPRLSNIKFNGIGFVNTGIGSVAYLSDVDNIRFNNCRFSSGFTQGFVLSFGGTTNNNDSVTNCTFLNGTEALRFFDAATNAGAYMQGNTITGALNRGIIGRGINGGKIVDNTVQIGTTATPAFYGIYLYAPTASGAEVSRNKVTGSFSPAAINIDPGNSASNKTLASNNSILLTGTGIGYGIQAGGNFTEIYHNTVTVTNTNTASAGFNLPGVTASVYSSSRFMNNLVQNTGGGYCVTTAAATFNNSIINYNDYYYTGTFCVKNNTTNLSFTGWKAIADVNSINLQVLLNVDGYTHFSPCFTTTNISPVTTDIVGSARSLTSPTIGAFEVTTPYANNASMDSLVSLTGIIPGGVGFPVSFRIRNSATNTINTFTAAYQLNGGSVVNESFSSSINSCDTARFTFITPVSFLNGTNQMKVYITGINGGADANPVGDTITVTVNTPLNGIYTINPAGGTTNTNFTSFTNAVAALNQFGVSGPVTFKVFAGTYPENFVINAFTGMGPANPVVFEPGNGVTGSVVLSAVQSVVANSYGVRLNATNNISFRKLNIVYQNTNAAYTSFQNYGIYINNSKNISVDSCNIKDNYAADQTVTYSIGSIQSSGCTISNNYIYKQYQAIQSNLDTSAVILNNRIVKSNVTSVSIIGYRNLNFEKNYIDSSVVGTGDCLKLSPLGANSGNSKIIRNTILAAAANSILIQNAHPVTEPLLVANNFLYYTVNFVATGNIRFYHNSFYLKAGSAINMNGLGNGLEIKSNLIQVQPTLPAVSATFLSNINTSGLTISNNNYNASTGNIVAANATALSYEPGAKFEPVVFNNANSPVHSTFCGLEVLQLPGVTTDFLNNTRNATTAKGAVEIAGVNNDAGVIAMVLPSTSQVPELTPITLKVRVKNMGSNVINTISLRYSINAGVPVEEAFSTSLNPCDTASFTFGTQALISDLSNIKFYTQLVNGLPDALHANDTLNAIVFTSMSGVYTINKTGSGTRNYKSFGEADTAMMTRGLAAAVTFNVADGNYTEGLLNFSKTKIAGTSASNTITFQGNPLDSNFVVLGNAGTDFQLDSMSNFIIRKMRINKRITMGPGNCGNITIENCRLGASVITVNAFNDPAAIDSNIVIRNNTFESALVLSPNNSPLNASTQLYFSFPKGIIIENNKWTVGSNGGIVLDYVTAPVIRNNTISGVATTGISTASNYAICVYRYRDSAVITGNTILGFGISGIFTGFAGQYYPAYAIRLAGATGGSAKGIVANNYVQITNIGLGLGTSTSDGVLPTTDVYNLKVYHNTFRMESTSNNISSAIVYSGRIVDLSQASSDFRNNIISLKYTGTGAPLAGSGIGLLSSPVSNFANQNYNSYYTDYPVQGFSSIAAPALSNVNFAAWQASGRDVNSYFVYPKFSTTLADFHPRQGLIMNAGTSIAAVAYDIENENRSASTPDIGCDEFDLPSADAGVISYTGPVKPFAVGTQPVIVKIKNYGVANLTSVQINWKVNGTLQSPYSWTGVLPYDSTSATITIGNFNFLAGQGHNLVFWTSLPNTYNDTIYVNDTLKLNNVYAALNGVYTIGGASPDFINFTNTTATLNLGGVLGPVTFRARNGTYTENITLKEFQGVNATNTVTYESETGDSSQVTLKWTNNFTNTKNTITLDSADYYTFRKMGIRFEGSGNTGLYAVGILNGATHNSFQNCFISSDASNATVIKDNGTVINDHFLNLANNRVVGTIPFDGTGNAGTNKTIGLRIEGNVFESVGASGMNVNQYRGLVISGNTFKNGTGTAMSIVGIDSAITISKNRVYGGFSIALNAQVVAGSAALPANISNNMFTTTANAITGSSVSYWNLYHNSIRSGGANALNLSTNSNFNIKNNILQSATTAMNLFGTTSLVSNYNDLYSNGTLVINNSTSYTFSTWKAFGQDLNSLSVLPVFYADSNLHLPPTSSYFNGKAIPVATVTDDMDGELRNITIPDMGADEYNGYQNDASPFRIISPLSPFTAGSQTVQVRIKNTGSNNLTAAVVKWLVNGVPQPDYNYSGNLVTGDSATITLGNYNFSNYGGDSLLILTSLPNGAADEYIVNDSIGTKLFPALCGTYTIAGASPDFSTVHNAVVALNNGGISCPVVFNIRNGVYNVSDTIYTIKGSSIINSVTFQSEAADSSAVTLQANCSANPGGIFALYGVNNLNLKYLGFRRVSDQASTCSNQNIIGSSSNLTSAGKSVISNNWFRGTPYSNSATFFFGNDSLIVLNNRLDSANLSLFNNAYSNISNNIIKVGTLSINSLKSFVQNNVLDSGSLSVLRAGGTDSCFVTGNIVNRSAGGMQVNGFTRGQVSKNKITLSGSGATALLLSNGADAGGNLQVFNNFISVLNNYPANIVSGISNGDFGNLYNSRIWNNSVNILNTNPASRAMHLYFFSNTQIKNNSFANPGGGYAIYLNNNSLAAADTCNYNSYYTTGANLGYYAFTNRATLATWKTATGKDNKSIAGTPVYAGASDLHSNSPDLNNSGGNIPQITTDIDNETRNPTTPDIGADEFNVSASNLVKMISIVSHHIDSITPNNPASSVSFRFRNMGISALTSASFKLNINGIDMGSPLNWSGTLNAGDTSAVVAVGNFNFRVDSIYNIAVINSTAGDAFAADDTVKVLNKWAALNGTYTVAGVTPDLFSLPRALLCLENGGYTGNILFNIRNGNYAGTLTISKYRNTNPDATITFTSESGDSSLVTLTGSAPGNAAIHLQQAKNIIFRKIGFAAGAADCMLSLSKTYNVTVEQCNFSGAAYGISSHYKILTGGSSADTNLVIRKNYFTGNTNPIDITGYEIYQCLACTDFINMTGLLIDQNTMVNTSSDNAIIVKSTNEAIIKNNSMDAGLSVDFSTSTIVSGNKVIVKAKTNSGFGLFGTRFTRVSGSLIKPLNILNNGIIVDGNKKLVNNNLISFNGMNLDNCSYADIQYNTISIFNGDTACVGMRIFNTANNNQVIHIKNNNIAAQNGKAIDWKIININSSNYNNIFSGDSAQFGVGSGTYYNSLNQWQSANPGLDNNSVSIDPAFMGKYSYRPLNSLLDNKGNVVAGYTVDIDSVTRHASTPDIGCMEFGPLTKDMQIVKLVSPLSYFPEGSNPVKLLLRNNGSNTLTSAVIKWKMDGVLQPVINWTGSLAITNMDTVLLGNYNFAIKTDNDIEAWIENPNGSADDFAGNDTIRKPLWCGLSRTYIYNQGAPQPGDDFNNMFDLTTQLYNGGVAAPAIIKIRSEQNLLPLYFAKTPGTSTVNTLTFEPLANALDSVRVRANSIQLSDNYAARFDNCQYLRFNKMKFENINTIGNYTNNISFYANSKNILFDSCRFIAKVNVDENAALASQCNLVQALTTDSLSFNNCLFTGGGFAINTSGLDWFYGRQKGLSVLGSRFTNQLLGAVNVIHTDSFNISKNNIINTIKYKNFKAIYLEGANDAGIIKNNIINVPGDGFGLYVNYYGNYTDATQMPLGKRPIQIVNNFIQIGDTAAATRGVFIHGAIGLYHNNIHLTSNNSNVAALEYSAIYGAQNNYIEMLNNIYYVDGPGLAVKTDEVTFPGHLPTSDYNDLFTKGAYLAKRQNSLYANLSDWFNGTTHDLNGRSFNPLYWSKTNLHIRSQYLNNAALVIPNIDSLDIDGEPRSKTTPDIGADEFYTVNAGVAALVSPRSGCGLSSTEHIVVKVKNYGLSAQGIIPVAYRVNNGVIVRDTIGNLIAVNDSLNYSFPVTAAMNNYGSYFVEAWTEIPGDSSINNDTTYKFIYSTPLINNFPYSTDFEIDNGNWFTDGANSSWQWGVIHSGTIDTASSGTKGSKTNLVGSYKNNELSYFQSPCFDLSGFATRNPWLYFSHAYQLETGVDKSWVEYSTDAGIIWTKLGSSGQGQSWYNNATEQVWDNVQATWHQAGIEIPADIMTNRSAVRFRFVLQTNGNTVYDGVAVDDIFIDSTTNTFCQNSTIKYNAGIYSAVSYQWQKNDGSGYVNVTNDANFNGAAQVILSINNLPGTATGTLYRCSINTGAGIVFSTPQTLRFINKWTGNINTDWFNAGNWSCGGVPDEYSDVIIPGGRTNYPTVTTNAAVRKVTVSPGAVVTIGSGVNFEVKGK